MFLYPLFFLACTPCLASASLCSNGLKYLVFIMISDFKNQLDLHDNKVQWYWYNELSSDSIDLLALCRQWYFNPMTEDFPTLHNI